MRNFKFKIAWLLLVFYCIGSQAQQNVSELVEKAFANSRKESLVKQEIVTNLIAIDEKVNAVNINQDIKQSKYLDFNKTTANELIAKNSETLSIQIIDDYGKPLVLDLINTSAFFDNLKITTGSNKTFDFKTIKSAYYAGVVRGSEKGSLVSISIFEKELVGIVSIGGIGNLVIGKMKNSDLHIVYNDKAIADKFDFKCGTDALNTSHLKNEESSVDNLERPAAGNKCVRMYLETEFDIFQDKGTVANVTAYVTGLHNQVATIYLNEGINTPLSEIKIWDALDPYTLLTSSDVLIYQYYTNMSNYNGDMRQLLTFRALGGGSAGLPFHAENDLCFSPKNNRSAVSQIFPVFNNIPIYSNSVMVITHEFGHVLSSDHTWACKWNGNNTAIDDCGPFIIGCFTGVNPTIAVGGTLMSYCHLTNIGINFVNGFGHQPGDKIRSRVFNSTSCLTSCTSCLQNLTLNTPTTTSKYIQVSNNISASSIINDNLNINLKAKDLLIQSGFAVKSSLYSNFIAQVDPCSNTVAARSSNSIFENSKSTLKSVNKDLDIAGLEIYPNPVSKGVFYVNTTANETKNVVVVDLLGKQVLNTTTSGNEINVSKLNAGVYIVKVTEEGKTATRKLVIQ